MVPNYLTKITTDLVRSAGIIAAMAAVLVHASIAQAQPSISSFPATFDPYPTTLPSRSAITVSSGRTVLYSTFGPTNGTPVLVLHGTLSSAATIDAFSPYRTGIEALNLRFISPERTGYGDTPYDTTMTVEKYAADWNDLLTALGYSQVKVLALSGGGVYAAHFVTRYPSRVTRLHLASAVNTAMTFSACPVSTPYDYLGFTQIVIDNPSFFSLLLSPPDLDVEASLPGFTNWNFMNIADVGDPVNNSDIGFSHDFYTYCNSPVTDFSMATFPTFIYHGEIDPIVPISDAELHANQYPNVAAFRRYPNGAHFVGFRHMGQLLLDMIGLQDKRIVCHGNISMVVSQALEATHLAHGDTTDICAWDGTPAENQ
jgi:pimeloyl-ACP methyl ester carboxylesterase